MKQEELLNPQANDTLYRLGVGVWLIRFPKQCKQVGVGSTVTMLIRHIRLLVATKSQASDEQSAVTDTTIFSKSYCKYILEFNSNECNDTCCSFFFH